MSNCKEKRKIFTLLFLALCLVFSAGCSRASRPVPESRLEQAAPYRPAAAAFYVNGRGPGASYDSFYRYKDHIREISPLWYYVHPDGSLEEEMDQEAFQLARDSGIKVIPLAAFSSNKSSAVLTDPGAMEAAIANISRVVRERGYDGMNIDFEIVSWAGDHQAEREGLTRFAVRLGEEMASLGKRMDICVTPPEQPPADLAAIYDCAALSGPADRLVVMAYNYSFSGTKPGPVAPLPWVEANIKALLALGIPSEKISLGVASYGYDWLSGGTRADAAATGEVMRMIEQKDLAAEWDGPSQTPYVKYRDSQGRSREIWFENSVSAAQKFELIEKYSLAGFFLWRLGYEDELLWRTANESLR